MILWWFSLAWADPAADIARQRELVDRAAAACAEARMEGLRRSEVAERYAEYRAAKLELDRLRALSEAPPGWMVTERRLAVDTLRVALAEGERQSAARDVVAAWLGEPRQRLTVLGVAIDRATTSPPAYRRPLLLDVLEQTDALAVLVAFDVASLQAERSQLELRAASLRRRAPGQSTPMADEIEAIRLLGQARAAEERASVLRALLVEVGQRRAAAMAALAQESP